MKGIRTTVSRSRWLNEDIPYLQVYYDAKNDTLKPYYATTTEPFFHHLPCIMIIEKRVTMKIIEKAVEEWKQDCMPL